MADTKRIITCPACDKEMTKVYIDEANCNVDICLDGCGGILFDNRELKKFDEEHENADEIFEALRGKNYEPLNKKEVRICSVCDTPMVKQGTGIKDIEIDVCNVCGAVFLDNGELEKIRKFSLKKEKHNAEQDVFINTYIDANPVITGGKIGLFAKNNFKTTPLRNTVESFVQKFLYENYN